MRGLLVRGGERDEDVSGAVRRNASDPAESERGPADEPVELVREQRRVGRRDDDDRTIAAVGVAPGRFGSIDTSAPLEARP